MKPVRLNDIAEHLDCIMDGWKMYYNKKTGKITEVQVEYLGIAEESEEEDGFSGYDQWEQEAIKEAIDIIENEDDYIRLPDEYDIHEYSIMQDFCYSIEDEQLNNKLCNAITGRGAFRRFKDAMIRYDLEDSWYAYKHQSLRKIAQDWCKFNNIPWIPGT